MMIDEVNASKKSYIHETPQYTQWGFLGQQDKRFMNRKSDGGHPFSQQPSQTFYEDPLIVGSKEHHNGSFLQYNNRAVESSTKHLNGGAMMYQQDDSDSDSSYSSSSDEEEGGALMYQQPKADQHEKQYTGGDLSQMSKEELMDMIKCGGGIYDDYIKPAGKFLGNVGKEIVNDVIVPVGKELVKDAVKGAVMGAGKRGRPKGSKNKSKEKFEEVTFGEQPPKKARKARTKYEEVVFEHPKPETEADYMKKMDIAHRGEMAHLRDEIAKLTSEKGRVEGEKKFEEGMVKEAPKKARKPRRKVLKNVEDELHRVEGETKTERAKMAVAKLLEPKVVAEKKVKVKRGMTDKAIERVEIVKQVMKDRNLKLGAASKYVKEHNLWTPAKGEWV
jgi:hypothetical protein